GLSASSQTNRPWQALGIPLYLGAILLLVPRLMRRWASVIGTTAEDDTVLVMGCAAGFLSSLISEYVGLGYLLGAFLARLIHRTCENERRM
ncbi:MAG: hypothetical protein KGJ78_18850, partial [Alphaproteobacteria bacterium]|nr:hypothetical protein [Alphaproteobacteria bacterium]